MTLDEEVRAEVNAEIALDNLRRNACAFMLARAARGNPVAVSRTDDEDGIERLERDGQKMIVTQANNFFAAFVEYAKALKSPSLAEGVVKMHEAADIMGVKLHPLVSANAVAVHRIATGLASYVISWIPFALVQGNVSRTMNEPLNNPNQHKLHPLTQELVFCKPWLKNFAEGCGRPVDKQFLKVR